MGGRQAARDSCGRRPRTTASARRSWKPVSCPRTAGLRLSPRVTSLRSKATCPFHQHLCLYGQSSICYLGFSFLGCFVTLKIHTVTCILYKHMLDTECGNSPRPGVGVLLQRCACFRRAPGALQGHSRHHLALCHLASCRAYSSEVQPQGTAGPCRRVPGRSQA